MSNLLAAKAATQWRGAAFDADNVFGAFAGLVVIHRRADGLESAPVVRGAWQTPPAFETTIGPAPRGERSWLRALQLYDRTWLFVAALLLSLVGCAVEPRPEPVGFSCVIRFQCVGSTDVLARLFNACALDETTAERTALEAGADVAADRCGADAWEFAAVTCEEEGACL